MGDHSKKEDSTNKGRKKSNDPVKKKKQKCEKLIHEIPTLYIMATCDWEGRRTNERGVQDNVAKWNEQMVELRKRLDTLKEDLGLNTAIPITHFMTPRTDRGFDFNKLKTDKVILDEDEIGLHIHCWTDLLSEVISSITPDEISEKEDLVLTEYQPHKGHMSPLITFDGINTIVKGYKEKLEEMTGITPMSFRAGAWMTSDEVYEALTNNGIRIDSSPLPYDLCKQFWEENYLKELWGPQKTQYNTLTWNKLEGKITTETQPYRLETRQGKLLVFPMTWGMDVNTKVSDIVNWAHEDIRKVKEDKKNRFANLGFHDTLTGHKDHHYWLNKVLDNIKKDLIELEEDGFRYEFVTMKTAAAIARKLEQESIISL
jgi:hypothetical protein